MGGVPTTIAEPACGVPVVAQSAVLGKAIDGSPWGITADEFDLYRVVRDLLQDKERLVRMGRAGFQHAMANYSEENVVAKFIDGLNFTLDTRRRQQKKAR